MFEFDIINSDELKAKFVLRDIDLSVVNALRRVIISEIPNVAFYFDPNDITRKDIKVYKNTCALHNEFLSHRISLLPLCYSANEIATFDPSNYIFKLKKKNSGADIVSVTTRDIQIYDKDGHLYPRQFHEKILPKNKITGDYILITKLKPNLYNIDEGEEIDIECKASKNTAITHARWSPVSQCSFINVRDDERAQKGFEEKIAKLGPVTEDERERLKKQFYTMEADRYFKQNKYDEPSEFEFTLESECSMTPIELFKQAFSVLIDKFENLQVNLRKKNNVVIRKVGNIKNFYEIELKDETYTLLNVLQSMIYNYNFRGEKHNILEFIGYYNPHPLETKMILKIKFTSDAFEDNSSESDLIKFLIHHSKLIIKELEGYLQKIHE